MTEVVNRSPAMGSERALQTALEMSMMDINNIDDDVAELYSSYEEDSSKSLNVTQCVSVPSSEHVAEIVGKQGCKIKALRARTNTYIKTPVRGEEPVFSISGRPDHVSSAKWEIIAAADHFSQIRATRPSFPKPPSPLGPGFEKVVIYVRVPYRVVGLVVGQKGATVKRIQQVTKTFIVTPSRDKEPYFEVRGTPENVERARKEIESYIVLRTGECKEEDQENQSTDLLAQQMQQCQLMDPQYPAASLFSPNGNPSPLGDGLEFPAAKGNMNFDGNCGQVKWKTVPTVFTGMQFTPPDISYQPLSAPLFTPERSSSLGSGPQPLSPTGSYESNCSDGLGTTSPKQSPRSCYMCKSAVGMATLVPCGHNMFCQTCAHYISCSSGSCPFCNAQVTNVYHM